MILQWSFPDVQCVSGGVGGEAEGASWLAVIFRRVRRSAASCRRPFLGKCVRANDGHFYCSNECADEGDKIDLTHVAPLKRAKGYEIRG
jgi:hypothetical protein